MSEVGTWVALSLAAVALLVAATYLAAPRASWSGPFFACAVTDAFAASGDALAVVRRYRHAVLAWSAAVALFVPSALAVAGASDWGTVAAGAALLVQLAGCSAAWAAAHRAALAHALPALPATVRRAALTPVAGALAPLLDLGGLLPLAAAGWWLHARWADIPARFAVHWGLNGPDRWGSATPGQVFGPLGAGAGMVVLLAGLHWYIEASTPSGATARARANRAMASTALTGSGWLLGAVAAAAALTALTGGPGLVLAAALGGTVALSVLMVVQLVQMGRLPPDPSGAAVRSSGWRAGGLFYVAPDDPALWVPKAVGLGYAVNLGHPRGKLALALLVGLPLAMVVALTWLTS